MAKVTEAMLNAKHDIHTYPGHGAVGWRYTVHRMSRTNNKVYRYDVVVLDDVPDRHRTAVTMLLAAHKGPCFQSDVTAENILHSRTDIPGVGTIVEYTMYGPSIRLEDDVWDYGMEEAHARSNRHGSRKA